ncbi:MAG: T9SS type A sorting domain-containing protein [Bacteroidota bacterium]|nr:T9SS type A sorting domain-containing protein [Bacteroidota bacterium]
MKKIFPLIIIAALLYIYGFSGDKYNSPSSTFDYKVIDANEIKTVIFNDGEMDRGISPAGAGFEWPKNSNKFAIYSSGFWIGAKINDSIRVAIAEYGSAFKPGYFDFNTQTPQGQNDPSFRLYKVSPSLPNGNFEFDAWSLWPVSQGAEWVDANMNGIYEPPTDYPVMKGSQNLFCSFTDGYRDTSSNPLRTLPLRAEVHLYVWAKENPSCADAINYEWKIINKNISAWTDMSAAIWSDVDIGSPVSDLAGTDSALNLVFGYKGINSDPVYGAAPPAVGYTVKEASGHGNQKADFASRWRCGFDCPVNSTEIFNVMHGLKANGNDWINPITNRATKFPFSGDPDAATGWLDSSQGERYVIIGSMMGSVASLDTVEFKTVTFIKRGSNNLTSVSEIKNCVSSVIGINNLSTSIPDGFKLYQNYPNPFNPTTNIKYQIVNSNYVELKIYNVLGKQVITLVNQKQNAGTYTVDWNSTGFPSGVYFYTIKAEEFQQTKRMILLK